MLSYMPTLIEDKITNRFNTISFLEGSFDINVYSYTFSKGWIESGKGSSICVIEDTFITENIELNKEECIVNLKNTIGCDIEDNKFRLLTLDIPLGNIDVYMGKIENRILTFNNLDSDTKTTNEAGEEVSFKLIYKALSRTQNELVVGYKKAKHKTWVPFVKNIYTRK